MELLIEDKKTIAEVFSTVNGGIYQCDTKRCWYINFAGKTARFNYRNLLKLRKAINRVNIERLLLNSSKSADLEIIFICACEHCYVLTLLQIIALKEILDGTFVMLELNQIINERVVRKGFLI